MQNTVIPVTPVIPQNKQSLARDGLRPDTVITGANLVTCDGDGDSNDGDDGDLRLNEARLRGGAINHRRGSRQRR